MAVQHYSVLDLGTLGGERSKAYDINSSGQIVGFGMTATGAHHAFRTSPYSAVDAASNDLGVLPGGDRTYAYSINASGNVVGDAYRPAIYPAVSGDHAFRYSNGVMEDLGTLGGSWSYAFGINASNQVVGGAAVATGSRTNAFLHSGNTMHNLGALNGLDLNSWAHSINSSGRVVGFSEHSLINYWEQHAFLWTPRHANGANGEMVDLGTLGGNYSYAWSINDNNEVVGAANLPGDVDYHAFHYLNGVKSDLGTLGGTFSEAYDINLGSKIVGASDDGFGNTNAFVYVNGAMYNLNDFIPAGSGWVLDKARAINDSGYIVGWGTNPQGLQRAFLLAPSQTHPMWNVDADGDWPAPENWLNGVPDGVDATAEFGDVIQAPRTVSMGAPHTVARLEFDSNHAYTLAGDGEIILDTSVGTPTLTVVRGNHTIAAPVALNDTASINVIAASASITLAGELTASAGVIKRGGGTLNVKNLRASDVTILGGTVRVAEDGGDAATSAVSSLVISGGGKLDLENNKLIVRNQSLGAWEGTGYTGVTGLIARGRNGGSWDGSGIITSQSLAASPSVLTTLAVSTADLVDLESGAFGGMSITGSEVLVMYTFGGDANLDGLIDGDDYFQIDSNVGMSGSAFGYHNGDFNYDGAIDGDDYFIIDSNVSLSPSLSLSTALTAVPEPATPVTILGLCIASMLARRRRSSRSC